MDGDRFDNLTRAFAGARSRRSVVRGLIGVAGGALLALLGRDETGAAGCSPRCGRCETCRRISRRVSQCVPRVDGTRCGECGVCLSGQCTSRFVGNSGCDFCQRCNQSTFACESDREGELCAGNCGTCQSGRCQGDDSQCSACERCRQANMTCESRCRSGQRCCREDGTCAAADQCCSNEARCELTNACCTFDEACTVNGCCDVAAGDQTCGEFPARRCCRDGTSCCIGDDGADCCPRPEACCDGSCCEENETCIGAHDNECCEIDRVCKNLLGLPVDCCRGETVCTREDGCCPAGPRACGQITDGGFGEGKFRECCDADELCVGDECCPSKRACSAVCCPEGQVCGDRASNRCCTPCAGDECCPEGQTCINPGVFGDNFCCDESLNTPCGDNGDGTFRQCCSNANEECCPDGTCAPPNCCPGGAFATAAADLCCPFGPPCGPAENQRCCAEDQQCCNAVCQSFGQCCAVGETQCGEQCCLEGESCCGDRCCQGGTICCGSGCCPVAFTCCGAISGGCWPPEVAEGSFCCTNGFMCPNDSTCCPNGFPACCTDDFPCNLTCGE